MVVETLVQAMEKKEPMLIRYQSIAFPLWDRLKVLWLGKLWVRMEYDWDGSPSVVSTDFQLPEDAVPMTFEELRCVQRQIRSLSSME